MVVIRRVVPMGSDTAAVAAQPKFKHIIRELLEEYLDEDVHSDRLRELQYAKQHAWETEGQFGDRIVALNAALGALLDGKELKAVLVQGVSESLRAAARQYTTAGRSFTKLKANLDREGKSFRALHNVKLAPKPPARNRLSLTPRSKAPASKALGGTPQADGDVATVDPTAAPWDWHAAQAAMAAAEGEGSAAFVAGTGGPAPSRWGPSPAPRTGYRRTTEFASPLTRGPGPAASGAAGSRLGTAVPFSGRPNAADSHAGRDSAHPRGYPAGGPMRCRGACVVCYDPGHWAEQCPIMTPEQQERARNAREAVRRAQSTGGAGAAAVTAQAAATGVHVIHEVERDPGAYETDDGTTTEEEWRQLTHDRSEGEADEAAGDADDESQGNADAASYVGCPLIPFASNPRADRPTSRRPDSAPCGAVDGASGRCWPFGPASCPARPVPRRTRTLRPAASRGQPRSPRPPPSRHPRPRTPRSCWGRCTTIRSRHPWGATRPT